MKRCPRCKGFLKETLIGGLHVDGCDTCGGVWFDHAELGTVVQTDAGDLLAIEDQFLPFTGAPRNLGAMACPNCHVRLYPFEFPHSPGIELDACPQCKGIWADNGELQTLYIRVQGSRAGVAPANAAPDARLAGRQALGILAGRPCPNCRKMNPSIQLACYACGASLPKAASLLCPNCDVNLNFRTYESLRLDVCTDCTGVWLDAGEISSLSGKRPEELQKVQDDTAVKRQGVSAMWKANPTLLCPRCCVGMIEQEMTHGSGVRLDACERCNGVWVGAGKLSALSQHYVHSLNRRLSF